jgi:hypothetical protein
LHICTKIMKLYNIPRLVTRAHPEDFMVLNPNNNRGIVGCHNSKVRWFSQGLPCKTPLRTHSNQAMLLPSTQSGPNP